MKLLVAYASKRGSTAEIAEAVAERARQAGLEVDCLETGEVSDLAPYDAVIVGSAVYMKRWRGDARRFLRRHRKALAAMPFWVFSSGPTGDPAKEDPRWSEPPGIVKRAEKLGVREHVVFGGRMPVDPQGPIEKAMVEGTPAAFRDRRDWEEIRGWADRVAAQFAGGAVG